MCIKQISPVLSLSWNGVTTDSFHTRIFMLVARLEKTKLARLTMCFAKHEKTRLIWFDYVLWVSCMKRVWVSGLAFAMNFVFQTHSHFEMTMCFGFCEFLFPSLFVVPLFLFYLPKPLLYTLWWRPVLLRWFFVGIWRKKITDCCRWNNLPTVKV